MTKRKAFSLRIDEAVLEAVQRYADDELRSLNAQIEYLLRDALRDAGRLPKAGAGLPDADRAAGDEASTEG